MPQLSPEEILQFLRPDETAADFLQRQAREKLLSGLPWLDSHLSLRPGVLLELCGPAASAKSEVLIQVAVHVLLQGAVEAATANAATPAQGQPYPRLQPLSSIVLLDLDAKFDALRFMRVLRYQTTRSLAQCALSSPHISSPSLCTHIEQSCMARLHVLTIHSSMHLLASLLALPTLIGSCHAVGHPCRLVLVDSITAFSSQDRGAKPAPYHPTVDVQSAGGVPPAPPFQHSTTPPHVHAGGGGRNPCQAAVPPLSHYKVQEAVAAALQRLAHQLRFCVIATRSMAVSVHKEDPSRVPGTPNAQEAAAGTGHPQFLDDHPHHAGPDTRRGGVPHELPVRLAPSAPDRMPAPWLAAVTHRLLLSSPTAANVVVPATVADSGMNQGAQESLGEGGAAQQGTQGYHQHNHSSRQQLAVRTPWVEVESSRVEAQLVQGGRPVTDLLGLHVVCQDLVLLDQ